MARHIKANDHDESNGEQTKRRPRSRSRPKRVPDPAPFVEKLLERRSEWSYEEEARRHPTLLIRRTLRSGQRVRFYGNVVVLGDVNPGAEITAGGDIIVMGWLRGLAHAGAEGDETAVVGAFRLNPTQLRIAHYIARAPEGGDAVLPEVPEVAEVRDGQLVIDRWQQSVLVSPKL
jgi:septum site-determining protein MinC